MEEINTLALLLKILISVAGFFSSLGILALFKMAKDINSMKTFNEILAVKHDQLTQDHKELKHRFENLMLNHGKN